MSSMNETILIAAIVVYGLFIIFGTKWVFEFMMARNMKENVAIYYNRKILHMFCGGLIGAMAPSILSEPIYALYIGIVFTVITYIPYYTGHLLYWVQTKDNKNDVNFCFMAGVSVYIIWELLGDPYLAIMPLLFMAFGDGVTGIARNIKFGYRTKNPIGNVFMAIVCIPMGYYLGDLSNPALPIWGVIAAIVATFVERYEFGPIDDNILITVSATIVLFIGNEVGPLTG